MNRPRAATPAERSVAWPLALSYVALVIYASLYPFSGWREQGVSPLAYLDAPWPRYWTGFDVTANLLGYVPLGFLLALALRSTGGGARAWLGALGAALLSLALEAVQSWLPLRVPSRLDWVLNTAGATLGVLLAVLLLRWGGWERWRMVRRRHWRHDAPVATTLLALWPLAVLFPTSVPFGLGQVGARVQDAARAWLSDMPWVPIAAPLPPAPPLGVWAESLVVGLGALAPCLLAYALSREPRDRLPMWALWLLVVALAQSLSGALTYGPANAWAWLSEPVWRGLLGAALVAFLLALSGWRGRVMAALLALALATGLVLLNGASDSAYLAQSLAVWEQGRFIRFHGASQWLGWSWPFATLLVALGLSVRREPGV